MYRFRTLYILMRNLSPPTFFYTLCGIKKQGENMLMSNLGRVTSILRAAAAVSEVGKLNNASQLICVIYTVPWAY